MIEKERTKERKKKDRNKRKINNVSLKVLTNEKRDWLAVVPFDRSRFKLFSRKTNWCRPHPVRHKTAPQTLFLLFANYNCFPITL
jgi:hypothetical protein